MSTPDSDLRHAVALFRYGVIADLVRLEPGAGGFTNRLPRKPGAST